MFERFGSSKFKNKIKFILVVKHAIKNFSSVAFNVLRNNFPISVTFNDGAQMNIANIHDLVFLSRHDAWKYCQINEGVLSVRFDGKTAKFSDWRYNADIYGIFITEDYKSIPVKNSIVVDVGANIGDSSIYFALSGAKKVIAIEPIFANYQCLKNNVRLNNLNNIELKMVGVSGTSGEITVAGDIISSGHMTESTMNEGGQKIDLVSLKNIVDEYKIDSGILKMDVEGYEHGIIMSSNPETLLKFKHIFAELHYETIKPINEIKEKLEQIGFVTSLKYVSSSFGTSTFIEAKNTKH